MMQVIISTRPDGGVSVTYPTSEVMQILTHGGAPEGYFGRKLDREWEIEKFVRGGKLERVAVRWIDAVICGGLTDAQAYELIAEKDTDPSWSGKELWQRHEVPSDRWFRDSWRRSRNGGPIRIDLEDARGRQIARAIAIQAKRVADLRKQLTAARILRRDVNAIERSLHRLEALDDLLGPMAIADAPATLRAAWPQALN